MFTRIHTFCAVLVVDDALHISTASLILGLCLCNSKTAVCCSTRFACLHEQEVTQRILEAVGAVAGSSLEQTSWLSRNLEVKAQPQVCLQEDEDEHEGSEFHG